MSLKVSLIITTYNCKENFQKTMESIAEQDYDNIEIVIKDGMSDDGTLDFILQYEKKYKYPVKWKSTQDTGIYDAINQGYVMSTGDIIGIANDRFASKSAVSQLVQAIEDNHSDGVHADLVYMQDDKVKRYWHMGQGKIVTGWMPGHPTLYLKREVYEKYGLYNTSYKCSADYEFMIRILRNEEIKLAYIPEVLVSMYYGGTSTGSIGSYWVSIKESYDALRKNGMKCAWWIILLRTVRVTMQFLKVGVKEKD